MPRNGSGTYTRVSNSFSNPVAGTAIDPSTADAFFDDVETALNEAPSVSALATRMGGFPFTINAVLSDVNFNSANTDNPITISLPTGYTRYQVATCRISGASASLTTATCGLFTAAAAGGTAIVTSETAITVSTASENTNNNSMSLSPNNPGTMSYNAATLYFRVQTAQGSAATADVILQILPLP